MEKDQINKIMLGTIEQLSRPSNYKTLRQTEGVPLPSNQAIKEFVEICRALIFPGYFGNTSVNSTTMVYHTGMNMEKALNILSGQILSCICFDKPEEELNNKDLLKELEIDAQEKAALFLSKLPTLRQVLSTDVQAVYEGDPAAHSFTEVICCYPAILAVTNYRIAHELLLAGIPLLPRIITEMAHSLTGIDIHPGATIGEYFAIDHGTGIVIGETCVIGDHVKLYQGVTLGAKSFPLDENGQPIKGIPRHPILEDGVIIYSNATILGRITIGKGATIGGNIWVTNDVQPGEKITQNIQKETSK